MSWPFVMPPSRPPARLAPRKNALLLAVVVDRVLHLRAERCRALCGEPDLHALHGLHRNDRLRQSAVQPRIPRDVRAEARRHAVRDHFEDAADGIAGAVRLDPPRPSSAPRLPGRRSPAALRRFLRELHDFFPRAPAFQPLRPTAITWLNTSIPNSPQNALRDCANRHARRRFARAGPLQDVAGIVKVVLDRAGEVGVARTRTRHRLASSAAIAAFDRQTSVQFFQSVFRMMIAIGEPMVWECRTPATISARSVSIFMRPPRPKPCWRRQSSRLIRIERDRNTGRQSGQRRDKTLAMGLARGFEA